MYDKSTFLGLSISDTFEDVVLKMVLHHGAENPSHYCADGTIYPLEFVNQVEQQYELWAKKGFARQLSSIALVKVKESPDAVPQHVKRPQWHLIATTGAK